MIEENKPAADDRRDRTAGTEPQGPNRTPRLKKDGTPDRRGGKLGNRGNKHATGRKALPGYDVRKNYSFVATEKEYNLLKEFNQILRARPDDAEKILHKLGTPPTSRARRTDEPRKNRVIMGNEQERAALKRMLATIKDRYLLSYDVIAEYKGTF